MLAVGYVEPEMIFVMSLNNFSLRQTSFAIPIAYQLAKKCIELHVALT